MTERSLLWFLAILIALAGLALALLLPDIDWSDRLRFGAVAIVVFSAIGLLAYTLRETLARWATVLLNSRGERYLPALWAISPLVPAAAMVATALTFLAWQDDYALLIGSGAAVGVWLAGGIIGIRYVEFENANITTYGDFLSRVNLLERRIELLDPEKQTDADPALIAEAVAEARRQLEAVSFLMEKKGFLWVRGHGYNSLWVILHSAEAACLRALRTAAAVREGLFDESRLHDSKIDHREELLARLRNAISALDPKATKLFFATFNPATGAEALCPNTARETISEIRTEINSFNDSNYEGIVRLRNTILNIVPFAGLMGLTAVDAAILSGADQKHIVAFLGFFIAGSFAGLTSWVLVDLKTETSIQDFGLATARLFRTIAFSGLTAAAGVFVLAAILGAAGLNPAIADVADGSTATPSPTATVDTGGDESSGGPSGRGGGATGDSGDLTGTDEGEAVPGDADEYTPGDSESSLFGAPGTGAPSAIVLGNPLPEEVSPGRQDVTPAPTPMRESDGTPVPGGAEDAPTPKEDGPTDDMTDDPDTECDDDKVWPLRCVYDLEENPFGLIVAMILGVTPELFVNMLKLQGDRYLQGLKSTSPSQGK